VLNVTLHATPAARHLPSNCAHLEVGRGVAGAEVCLPVVEAEVRVARHQPLAGVKVGLHVGVRLEPVRKVDVAAHLHDTTAAFSRTDWCVMACNPRTPQGQLQCCRHHVNL
jgi:hypothetical protein